MALRLLLQGAMADAETDSTHAEAVMAMLKALARGEVHAHDLLAPEQ